VNADTPLRRGVGFSSPIDLNQTWAGELGSKGSPSEPGAVPFE